MKVALVHDHLAQDGGAEKVLEVLADMFPEAPIYTLLYDKNKVTNYKGRRIETSIIQKLPGGVKHYKWYLCFMPMAVEFFDLRSYDVVISDTSSFAKGVITLPNTLHISYCHTPTRYLWSDTHQYINELKYNKFFKKIISLLLNRLRIWDRNAADRVDKFVANSKTVANRIDKYYRRNSKIIYPPVEVNKFKVSNQVEDYYLIGCRLEPYKRVDTVIETFKNLGKDYKLKIFGYGSDIKRLKKIAKGNENIEFLGRVSEEKKVELYSKAQAFINPQEEDFGITAVEAMASGRPVIAYNQGGALETVINKETGVFFSEQTPENLQTTIQEFEKITWDSQKIREQAEKFSVSRFKEEMTQFITQNYEKNRHRHQNING